MDHVHTFSVQAMVCGYHVYKSIWDAACDDNIFLCEREIGIPHDLSSTAAKKGIMVGHVLRKISATCFMFIHWGGTILCRVNGSWCYSSDLPQEGLEVPCILSLSAPQAHEWKIKQLIVLALPVKLTSIPKIMRLHFLQGYLVTTIPAAVPP